jgi:hypothetical protein
MKVAQFTQGAHGPIWINPLFVTGFSPDRDLAPKYDENFEYLGMRPRGGTAIRMHGQPSYNATWVSEEPDEVAQILSEALGD